MASWGTPLRTLFNAVYDSITASLNIKINPSALGSPDAYQTKATGTDGYAAVFTPSEDKGHLLVYNSGTHPVIISLDEGTTDHFYIPGQASVTFDNIRIAEGVGIFAKNGSAGNNYTNLYLSIW